jgi:hypothetical protein
MNTTEDHEPKPAIPEPPAPQAPPPVPSIIQAAYTGDLVMMHRLIANAPPSLPLTRRRLLAQTDPRTGLRALHIAIGRNNLEMTKLLTVSGARYVPDGMGRMPSTIAELCEVDDELLDYVLEKEAEALDADPITGDEIRDAVFGLISQLSNSGQILSGLPENLEITVQSGKIRMSIPGASRDLLREISMYVAENFPSCPIVVEYIEAETSTAHLSYQQA